MTITRKLLLPTLLGIAIAIGALVTINLRSQNNLIVARENAQLYEAHASFLAMMNDRAQLAQALATSTAGAQAVRVAFAARNRPELLALTLPIYRELALHYRVIQMHFYLPPAKSFLRVNEPDSFGDDLSSVAHSVLQANLVKAPQVGLGLGRTGLGLRGVVPVIHQRRYIGSLEFGIALDDFFLQQFKSRSGAECAVYLTSKAIAVATIRPIAHTPKTHLPDLSLTTRTSLELDPAPELFVRTLRGETAIDRIEFNGKPYVVALQALYDYNSNIIGVIQICLPRGNMLDAMAINRNVSLLGGGVIGLLVVLAVAGLITRTLIRPLQQQTRGVQRFRDGDRRIRVPINSDDELGQLGRAFNVMADELADHVNDLERRVAERTADLTTANQELERFIYTVSHDLKSPLITIRGFLGFLEQAAVIGNVEEVRADMARIVNATDKMQQLLNELLELSRIGRLMNPPEKVSFDELAREAKSLVAGRLAGKSVEVEIAPDLPMVYGDRLRLREVLQNLLDNAIKFTECQPNPQVEVGIRYDGTERVFFVRDNGLGIDPHFHDKVFGLFEKLDSKTEGTGVGLAIVKRIIEVHGGRIWVESEGLGKGSIFCFTLPPRIV